MKEKENYVQKNERQFCKTCEVLQKYDVPFL